MTDNRIGSIVVVGAGVAGWLAALVLSKVLADPGKVRILKTRDQSGDADLLESWGSCLPPLRALHRSLAIDERQFMQATEATFKLTTEFGGWGRPQASYLQPLGDIGATLDGIAFHHHWLRTCGTDDEIAEFSLCAVAARLGRFVHPSHDPRSVLSTLDFAYHFDAGRYLDYLRSLAQHREVRSLSGDIVNVELRSDGCIEALLLDSGERIQADLFIDCSGARGLLIEQVLKTGFEDWSYWLPCDRAVTMTASAPDIAPPVTRATARNAGWQWHIPLQHYSDLGYVYCSRFVSDDDAATDLRSSLSTEAVTAPRLIGFTNGRRRKFWNGNCIALGLAAGCMEPLQSTSLHLIHSGLSRLTALFPHRDDITWASAEYNRQTAEEHERVRDLLIAQYRTAGAASPFWELSRTLEIPEPLAHKLRVFGSRGRIVQYDEETFSESHWASVLLGQQVRPERIDPLAQTLPIGHVSEQLRRMKAAIDQAAQAMPAHAAIIKHHCAAQGAHQRFG